MFMLSARSILLRPLSILLLIAVPFVMVWVSPLNISCPAADKFPLNLLRPPPLNSLKNVTLQ